MPNRLTSASSPCLPSSSSWNPALATQMAMRSSAPKYGRGMKALEIPGNGAKLRRQQWAGKTFPLCAENLPFPGASVLTSDPVFPPGPGQTGCSLHPFSDRSLPSWQISAVYELMASDLEFLLGHWIIYILITGEHVSTAPLYLHRNRSRV